MSGISYAPPSPLVPWPEFNSVQWILLNSSVTKNYVDSTFLMLSGGTMTGGINAININMSGNLVSSGNIQLTNAGSSISTIGTLSIPASSFYISSTLVTSTATELNYLHGVTPGTATASNAIVLDASRNITNINSLTTANITISSSFYISSTTDSTSTSTGSFTTLGGVGIAKSLYVGTAISIPNASGGDMIILTSTSTGARNTIKFVTDTQSWEIGSRGSTAANPNSFYIYNGAYKLVMNNTGDTSILSSTDSSSASTGCLKLSGGLGVVKNIYCTGMLTLDRFGSHLAFVNGVKNALIEVPGSVDILRLVRGYAINIGTNGINVESGSSRDPRCAIDLGQTASNKHIALFDNTTSWYGFSANNSNLQYSSNSGHAFYTTCTSASPQNNNTFTIDGNGNSITLNNSIPKALFCTGINNIGLSGSGVKVHWGGSFGEIFAYDYTNSIYKDLKIGNGIYMNCTTGFMGLGVTGSIAFPLVVLNSINSSITGGYGFLASGGAGSGTNTGSVPVSAYFGARVFATEFDAYSDERLKHMIEPIKADEAIKFIKEVQPIEYEWKDPNNAGKRTGYSAQQLLKTGLFSDLVALHKDDNMKSIVDSDGFESPSGYHFAIQYSNTVAILHKAIQVQQEQLELQFKMILELKQSLI